MRRLGHHYRRNGMLEDQLLLIVGLQHHRIFVEGADAPGELDAAQQVKGDGGFVFSGCVEKRILDVLRRLIHLPISPLVDSPCPACKPGSAWSCRAGLHARCGIERAALFSTLVWAAFRRLAGYPIRNEPAPAPAAGLLYNTASGDAFQHLPSLFLHCCTIRVPGLATEFGSPSDTSQMPKG